jgi:hypothetical protein
MAPTGRSSAYVLVWATVLLLFAVGVWWAVESAPTRKIDQQDFNVRTSAQGEQPSASINETLSGTDIVTEDAKLTVNGDDGKITMVIEVDSGVKRRSFYNITDGKLTFLLRSKQTGTDKETVVIRLANATYSKEAGLVTVRGTLMGQIAEGGHSFLAKEMSWDQGLMRVSTKEIQYRGPGVDVSGKEMSIDLETGEVRFNGTVDVGI